MAFEKLYGSNGKLITSHEDIKDKAQTIKIPGGPGGSKSGTTGNVKTGDTSRPIVLAVIAAAALAAAIAVVIRRRRRS